MRFASAADQDLEAEVDWRRCLRLGLVGAAIALALVTLALVSSPAPPPGSTEGGYTTLYTPPHTRFEVLLNHADGQAYATLAQDPTLSRPDAFVAGDAGASTFVTRPVLPYGLWALSLGRPGLLPVAFAVVEAVSGGLLVFGAAALVHAGGRAEVDRLALVVLAFPGAIATIAWLDQDVLALGLALVALVLWAGRFRRPVLAALLFVLAGLTRETMLLFPAVVAVHGWIGRGWRRRDVLLAAPIVAYVGWAVFATNRMGVATGGGLRRNLDWPFVGLGRSVGAWSALGVVLVLVQVALVVWSVARPVSRLVWSLVLTYALVMTLTARPVWEHWPAGVRVILPVLVLASLNVRLPDRIGEALRRSEARPAPVS